MQRWKARNHCRFRACTLCNDGQQLFVVSDKAFRTVLSRDIVDSKRGYEDVCAFVGVDFDQFNRIASACAGLCDEVPSHAAP